MCLLAQKRSEDAAEVLLKVMSESGDQWPLMAACHLWVLRLRQQQTIEADAIYETIASKYENKQLASMLPDDVRNEILTLATNELVSC